MSAATNVEEALKDDILVSCYDDPARFVLMVFPWGEPGTPLEHFPHGPDQWQLDEFKQMTEHIRGNALRRSQGETHFEPYYSATASGHGIGKSAMVAWLILFFMSTRPQCRGVVTANTGDQLNGKTWPELKKWHNMALNRHWFDWTATKFVCVLRDRDGKSQEENWRFDAATWSEERTEAFAGLHNASSTVAFIFDEASAIPDKIYDVGEGALTDGEGFQFSFGNPTRNTGRFKAFFTGIFRSRYKTRHVDSREVRITNKKKIEEDIALYGEDSDYVRVRIKGQFPRMGDKQFINGESVERAKTRVPPDDPFAPLIMGIDVAQGGLDRTVARCRHGADARSIPAQKWNESDTARLADVIANWIERVNPDAVCLDAGGGGKAIGDILKSRGFRNVHIIWFGGKPRDDKTYADKRTEMWADLGVALDDWLCIDNDQQLTDDLISPEKILGGKQGDQMKLESKESMKERGVGSPDDGDALALTFAVKVARHDAKVARGSKGGKGRVARDVDYPLFRR
jgi:hypothetical protein